MKEFRATISLLVACLATNRTCPIYSLKNCWQMKKFPESSMTQWYCYKGHKLAILGSFLECLPSDVTVVGSLTSGEQ